MARAFRATTRGYTAELEPHERRLISQLCQDVITILQRRGEQVDAPQESTQEDDEFAHFRRELAGLGENDDGDEGLSAPDDAVLARLLPDGATDQEEAAALRRLTESSLRDSLTADLRTLRMVLESDTLRISEEQAPMVGRAINAVRLTLAQRLGIDDDDAAERVHQQAVSGTVKSTDDFMAEIYTFATWLQESLFTAMLAMLPEDSDPNQQSQGY